MANVEAPDMPEDEAPEDMQEDDTAAPPQADADVVATILRNADGTYQLVAGDEPEPSEAPEEGEAPAQQGTMYSTVGELLKGVLELVKSHEASMSGEGSDEENFAAGYEGGANASPAKTLPTQATEGAQ